MSSKEDLITVNGVGFIPIKIDGQSFLFNQIRHMIALAVLIYRSGASNGVFDRVFSSKDPDILFPMVPGEFLFLDKCHYRDYQKRVNQHDTDMSFKAGTALRDGFVKDAIAAQMAKLELRSEIMATWLHWVYTSDKDINSFLPIFDAMSANGGARGAQGGSHMPPLEIVIDPITTAAFRNKTPYAKFNQLRHGFKLW